MMRTTLPFTCDNLTFDEGLTICAELWLGLALGSRSIALRTFATILLPLSCGPRHPCSSMRKVTVSSRPTDQFLPTDPNLVVSSLSPVHLAGLGSWRLDPKQTITYELGPACEEWLGDEDTETPPQARIPSFHER